MNDLFDREQQIFDHAVKYLNEIKGGAPCCPQELEVLVKEYGRLLKQLRRITKITDKTTIDLNASNLELLEKVHYDPLTGIYNRRFLEEKLEQIIKSVSRTEGTLSILMMDLDYFKSYNDTYGHGTGDDCLKMIAGVLYGCVTRAEDFVARYGGEEFVAVLPDTDEAGACRIAVEMLERIRKSDICHQKSEVADFVTISIGVTTGNVLYTQRGGDYIKRADEAMYISKQNGRNRYTFIGFKGETE